MTALPSTEPLGAPTTARRRPRSAALRNLLRDRLAVAALAVLVLMVVTAVLAPLIAPDDPNAQDLLARLRPPAWLADGSLAHPLGKWGGIAATKALAAHCETFGLGMNLHSGGELGIATAAHLAVVASTPVLSRAIDSMYYLHADDIIAPLRLEAGRLRVPTGPGLGVTVDEDKLRHFAALNEREGDLTG